MQDSLCYFAALATLQRFMPPSPAFLSCHCARVLFFIAMVCCASFSAIFANEQPSTVQSDKVLAQLQQEKEWVQQARGAMEKGSDSLGLSKALRAQPIFLREAVDLALRQNYGLQVTRYEPSLRADQVEIERAAFDSILNAGISTGQTLSPMATSSLEGATAPWKRRDAYGATLSQKLTTGATISLITGMQRMEDNSTYATINPYYSAQSGVRVVQPLLSGGGVEINLAPMAIAKANYQQSKYELRKGILDLMAETEIAYWNLSANYALKALRETSVNLANALVEENRERSRIGLAMHAEVLEAEAYLAARMENIIVAQQSIENAEDKLRALLGELAFESTDILEPQALPQDDPGLPEFVGVVRAAIGQDYDYFIQQEEIEKQRIRLKVARNQNQPSLNLAASLYGLGVDSNAGTGYSNSYKADGNAFEAGLVFSLPIGLRAERAQERIASKQLNMANIELAQVQQNLMAQVRQSWRGVAAGRQRRATTLASLELNLESYQRQHALYRAGLISFRDLLQAQTDLDNARITNLQATYDLIVADVQLKRLTGDILSRNGFSWKEGRDDAQTTVTKTDTARAKSSKIYKKLP